MLMIVVLLAVSTIAVVGYIILGLGTSGNSSGDDLPKTNKVMFVTSMGNILIELRDDMPITTNNFKKLVHEGIYNDTIFHRVVNLPQNLVIIQGGDPTGTGYGDPSIPNIQDEFTDNNKNERGTIAMANTGTPNSGSSQFFINGAYNSHLDEVHPVFGKVIEGMDVVDAILQVDTDENNRPIDDVVLLTAEFVY
jgi:peptidylprolyl isomerase